MGNASIRPHFQSNCCIPASCEGPTNRRAQARLGDLDDGIEFDLLECLFKPDDQCYFSVKGHKAGGIVESVCYMESCSGTLCAIKLCCLESGGDHIREKVQTIYVPEYLDRCLISKLPIRPCTPEILQQLTERGHKFKEIAIGRQHVQYSGNAFFDYGRRREEPSGISQFGADVRVVVAPALFEAKHPNYGDGSPDDMWEYRYNSRHENTGIDEFSNEPLVAIEEKDLWRCWPAIKGFAMGSVKRWGEFFVDQTSPIEYREDAFDSLVLDSEKKATVLAAVSHSGGFCDIVEGKGGGCVFLLHGPPGVGKTLTAEATAEVLHRPLYTLTSGELGTSPPQLEQNLSRVLQLAETLDSVILIDECDIFLNARDGSDVTRNALVGIFLRLLEYHKGILFMTTNRVDVFDAAVYSRVSIALEYTELDQKSRETVWRTLLDAAKVESANLDIGALAAVPANGRQIKNAVRLAMALHKGKDGMYDTEGFATAIRVAQDFKAKLGVGSGNYSSTSQIT